jgi:hypothetical protein
MSLLLAVADFFQVVFHRCLAVNKLLDRALVRLAVSDLILALLNFLLGDNDRIDRLLDEL